MQGAGKESFLCVVFPENLIIKNKGFRANSLFNLILKYN